jgi:hypothetical protein
MSEKTNEFHKHEVLDRLHIQQCNLEEHLLTHPFVEQTPELKTLIEEAQNALGKAYQLAGKLSL